MAFSIYFVCYLYDWKQVKLCVQLEKKQKRKCGLSGRKTAKSLNKQGHLFHSPPAA